ncbi:ABC-type multidrug transport system fused ATPase/permease subunit [Mucilaginibacter frigoritolerans]|uniref:ABC-type multidrug transport system fused ATPase/permease subunit n=1 Tax=Mucilaginibacter frigoritolerans TaxID=652788 RepID=A0A562TYU6_9SPHI|nr:ABC transporter ATP-binding protein [Mucilaginibacter frigoritolerans]TWI98727.1 ABC-type multidrug transport system fused ATPase/permease subunit [Mucilaginibacter frigoritolerans]
MKHLIKTVLSILIRKEKVRLCIQILLDLFIGILDIAFLGALLFVINFYTGNRADKHTFLSSLFNQNSLLLISIFFVFYAIKNWVGYLITKSQNIFFYAVASRLSKRNIQHYLKDDYQQFVHVDSSVYIRKISQQPIEFSNYILTNIQQIISQGALILFTVIGILFYHPSLFLSLFLLLLPPVVLLGYFIKKKLKDIRSNSKLTSQLTLQYLKESLSGYVESNVYNKNDFFTTRYYRYQKQLNDYIATQQTLQGLPSRLIEVFAVLGFLILMAINKWAANNHAIGLLDIGVFMAASYKIIPGIVKILNSAGQIKTYEFTVNDLANNAAIPYEAISAETYIDSIKFNQVNFNYGHKQILNNFCFEAYRGDFVGISGPSGLGKSTIINLLLGFLEQESGTISINHMPVDINGRKSYRKSIAYVKQQSFFINDSILKNIILTEGKYDEDKLTKALSFCGIDDIIKQYPEGVNKILTENAKNISGGQRQRLMLARALYHDFDVLILDEPFGEVDDAAEKTILIKLELLAKMGKMIIMITHNKNSLSFCNKVVLLDGAYA